MNEVELMMVNREVIRSTYDRLREIGFTLSMAVPPSRKNWNVDVLRKPGKDELALVAYRMFGDQFQMNVAHPVTRQFVVDEYALFNTDFFLNPKPRKAADAEGDEK